MEAGTNSKEPTAAEAHRRARARRWLLGWIGLVAVFKIFLIADQEVYARLFDDLGYASSVVDHYYGTDARLNWQFIRPLAFPLFGAVAMESGLPYRIWIELFFLGSAAWLSLGVVRATGRLWPGWLVYTTLAVHPWVLSGFSQFMTEPFFLSLCLLFIGLIVRQSARAHWSWRDPEGWLLGLVMAAMMLTRREGPWVFGLLGSFVALHLGMRWLRERPGWPVLLRQGLLVFIPLLTYQAIMLLVSTANYAKWGIFATNEQEAPGFAGLLNTLYKIDTPDPSLWAPVTSRTLELAMAASPQFARLREGLFNDNNPHLRFGEQTTGRKGELGAWMWWRLYAALAETGIYTSPKEADAWMREVSAELRAAMRKGELPARRFATPFPIDPNLSIWLPELPRRTWDALARLHYHDPSPHRFTHQESGVPALHYPVFNRAANRRAHHLAAGSVAVKGIAYASSGRLDFIALETASGRVVASTSPCGPLYWRSGEIRRFTGLDDTGFDVAFYLTYVPTNAEPLFLSMWKDGVRLQREPLVGGGFPQRRVQPPQDGRPGTDLTIQDYHHPHRGGEESLRALLRGWAFAADGPLTHVSFTNSKGQLLKVQAFTLPRPDIEAMYLAHVGSAPTTPLGFHIETPVLDADAISVQFWRDSLRVHEMPLAQLREGYWGTQTDTLSGIALTLGIGRQIEPQEPVLALSWREAVRAHLLRWVHAFLFAAAAAITLANLLRLRRGTSSASAADLWQLGFLWLFLGIFLLSRGLFYGLVEAAVVPGVSRYMEMAAPLASVWLVLAMPVFAPIVFEVLHRRRTQLSSSEPPLK